MTDPYCNRCGTPHQAGQCGRDNTDLRERIFKAIHDNCNLPEQRCRDIATAVHDQLGLDKEFGCATASQHGCRCSHRYVTGWTTTDEGTPTQ
jgi:hypothetical protein